MEQIKALLVDDEQDLAATLTKRLKIRGIDAYYTTSGQKALEQLKNQTFDIAIVDLKMPGLSGIEFMKKVRQNDKKIKFIFVSGHSSKQEAEEGLKEGAFDFLLKPVDIDILVQKIQLAMQQR